MSLSSGQRAKECVRGGKCKGEGKTGCVCLDSGVGLEGGIRESECEE